MRECCVCRCVLRDVLVGFYFLILEKKCTCEQGGGGREVGQRERENLRWVEPDAGLDPTTLGS